MIFKFFLQHLICKENIFDHNICKIILSQCRAVSSDITHYMRLKSNLGVVFLLITDSDDSREEQKQHCNQSTHECWKFTLVMKRVKKTCNVHCFLFINIITTNVSKLHQFNAVNFVAAYFTHCVWLECYKRIYCNQRRQNTTLVLRSVK